MEKDHKHRILVVGSGIIAEPFLHAMIRHEGESPEKFMVIGLRKQRCEILRKKYGIPATEDAFIRKADIVVLAIDENCMQDFPELVQRLQPLVPANALIATFCRSLRIAEVEECFP